MPRSDAGNASGCLRPRSATYWAVHSPMPGSAFSRRTIASRSSDGGEQPRIPGHGRREPDDRPRPRSGHADRRQVGRGELLRRREERDDAPRRRRQPIARPGHDPAGDRPGAGDGDLLADDRPDRKLERIPRAGNAQAGTRRDERGEQGVAGEVPVDRVDVRVEVEPATQATADRVVGGRAVDLRREAAIGRLDLDRAGNAVDADRPPISVAVDCLDPGDRTRGEECDERRPVERWRRVEDDQPSSGNRTSRRALRVIRMKLRRWAIGWMCDGAPA